MLEPEKSTIKKLQDLISFAKPSPLSNERFDLAHNFFESSSTQQTLILAWLKQYLKSWKEKNKLNALSIGCGNGMLDVPLLKFLGQEFSNVDYTAIDPNQIACKKFQDSFNKCHLSNVSLKLYAESVEKFEPITSFDVILVVQSLYYVSDPPEILSKIMNLLVQSGKLIVMLAPKGKLNCFSEIFWKFQKNSEIWFSDKFELHLQNLSTFFEKSRLAGILDVSKCFEEEKSEEGLFLLDFIAQADCSNLSQEQYQLCCNYLKYISRFENSKWQISHPVDVFLISK